MQARALLPLAGLMVISAAGLSSAHGAAQCEPTVKQTAKGLYTKQCGPAIAVARVHGKTYRSSPGSCTVGLDRKVRVFTLATGEELNPWAGQPIVHGVTIIIRRYSGPGTYSTNDRAEIDMREGLTVWITVPADRAAKKLGHWRGGGTVTVRPSEAGGSFTAPVPDGLGDGLVNKRPTVRISGSFTCR